MRLPIYLDYMATTPVDPRVVEIMLRFLDINGSFGNPASYTHSYGWQAEEAVAIARQQVADLIQAEPCEIVWTAGATEANNLAIKGAARFYQRKGKHIVTCKTEHKAVLDCCMQLEREGFMVTYLNVRSNGSLDLEELQHALRKDTVLVSLMHVNNEIGIIHDIAAIAELTRKHGILLHVDAAQSAGKIPINLQETPVDLMSFSAHKVYGPKGIGALYIRRQPRVRLQPLMQGGGQEQGLRPGTLPVHQIAAMGATFVLAKQEMQQDNQRITALREYLWQGIKSLADISINGDIKQSVANNLNVSFGSINGESLLLILKDLALSSSSACTSATIEPSYVLKALGLSDTRAYSSIRFSLGRFTSVEEIDYAIQHIQSGVTQLRALANF